MLRNTHCYHFKLLKHIFYFIIIALVQAKVPQVKEQKKMCTYIHKLKVSKVQERKALQNRGSLNGIETMCTCYRGFLEPKILNVDLSHHREKTSRTMFGLRTLKPLYTSFYNFRFISLLQIWELTILEYLQVQKGTTFSARGR